MKKRLTFILVMLLLMVVGCQSTVKKSDEVKNKKTNKEALASKELVIYSPHPLEFIDPLIQEFESQTNINVEVLAMGTGDAIKRIESETNNPLADVLWGGSIGTVKSKSSLFQDYQTVNEQYLADEFKNREGNLTRATVIPSILMINTDLVGDVKIDGYEDLLNPALKGKIAYADPSASSSSFEHLVNMLNAMGKGNPEQGWDYVTKFIANLDSKLLKGSSSVYKGVADGEYVVGLTFEEGGMNYVTAGAPVEVKYMEEGTIFRADGIYIIKGAHNKENAEKFLDFITGQDAQKKINDSLNRRTVRTDLKASPILKPTDEIKAITDDQEYTTAHKKEWLEKFKDIFTSAN